MEQGTGHEHRPDHHLEKAVRLIEIDQHDLAERELLSGLQQDPGHVPLHLQLGFLQLGRERWSEAEAKARETLALAPELPEAHRLLGLGLTHQGRHSEAETALLAGLSLAPESARLYLAYGTLTMRAGQLDKAERLLKKSLEHDPQNESAHGLLSLLLAEKKDKRAAHAHGEKGLSLSPDSDFNHFSLGVTLLQTGHPFKARQHLREALRIDPSDGTVEELYLESDRCCRWVYLPMYGWTLLLRRLPGKQFAIWGAMIVALSMGPKLGVSREALGLMAVAYVGICLYTWVATPLVSAWVKVRPPR